MIPCFAFFMLKVRLISFSNLLLEENLVETVNFSSYMEGRVGIHTDHESMEFKITPSQIILTKDGEEIRFFCGYGFASVQKNVVTIVGFPITIEYEEFITTCSLLDKYGSVCEKNFGVIL